MAFHPVRILIPEEEKKIPLSMGKWENKKMAKQQEIEPVAESGDESGAGEVRARGQTLWIRPAVWKAMGVVKEDIQGTWGRVLEIFLEKMISSGLMSPEAIAEVRKIAQEESIGLVPDSGWESSFRPGDSWPMAAGHMKVIAEETKKLGPLLEELVEAVEDHAIAMMDMDDNTEEPAETQ